MKAFQLVGLKSDGNPAFSCTVRAETLDKAVAALRCSAKDPLLLTMEHAVMITATKAFAGRPFVLVEHVFDGSFAAAIASHARASVPGIDAATVERSIRHCRRIFLGEAPVSA